MGNKLTYNKNTTLAQFNYFIKSSSLIFDFLIPE